MCEEPHLGGDRRPASWRGDRARPARSGRPSRTAGPDASSSSEGIRRYAAGVPPGRAGGARRQPRRGDGAGQLGGPARVGPPARARRASPAAVTAVTPASWWRCQLCQARDVPAGATQHEVEVDVGARVGEAPASAAARSACSRPSPVSRPRTERARRPGRWPGPRRPGGRRCRGHARHAGRVGRPCQGSGVPPYRRASSQRPRPTAGSAAPGRRLRRGGAARSSATGHDGRPGISTAASRGVRAVAG